MPMQLMNSGGPVVRASGSGNRRSQNEYVSQESEQYNISVSDIPVTDDVYGDLEGGYSKYTIDPKFIPPQFREEQVYQQRRYGGGMRYEDDEGRGIGFMMRRMSGTNMPSMSEGELSAQLPVAGGVLSLRASKPMNRGAEPRYNLQYQKRFAAGGAVDDARTTGLNTRLLQKAGMPPMDPNQVDPAVVDQVYRILGRGNG